MPWKAVKRGGKYTVYKLDADGNPTGDALGTHESKAEADKQVAALYASEQAQESTRKARTHDVHEFMTLSEATLDEDKRSAEVTLIRAGWSANGRYYPADVLQDSARLWEGVKAYANHPSKSEQKDRPERSVLDATGIYENVRFEDDRVKATFRPIGRLGDDLWPWVVESVKGNGSPMGLSIHALGRASKGEKDGKKGMVVEAITHANSVDFVTEPAAGGSFDRLLASDDGGWVRAVLSNVTTEELREARPDILADLKREWKTTRDSKALTDARADAAKQKQLAEAKDEKIRTTEAALVEAQAQLATLQKEVAVDRLLAATKLPADIQKELREGLLKATTAEAMQERIDQAETVLKAVRQPVRVTGAGRASSPQKPAVKTAKKNPVAEALGIKPEVAAATTLNEYLEASGK